MKTTNKIRKSLFAAVMMSLTLSFFSCSADSDVIATDTAKVVETSKNDSQKNQNQVVEDLFSLKLRGTSAGKANTSSMKNVYLYVFGSNGQYLQTVEVNDETILNVKTIDIVCPGYEEIQVIAWAGVKGENIKVSDCTTIADFALSLKNNSGYTSLPSDLFYGQLTLSRNQTKSEDVPVLYMERIVSQMQLFVSNAVARYGEGDYYFVVKQAGNSYDSAGNLNSDESSYIIPASVDATGRVYSEKFSVFAASDVAIELYKDDVLVFSTKTAKNGDVISADAGKLHAIIMSATQKSYYVSTTVWNSNIAIA